MKRGFKPLFRTFSAVLSFRDDDVAKEGDRARGMMQLIAERLCACISSISKDSESAKAQEGKRELKRSRILLSLFPQRERERESQRV